MSSDHSCPHLREDKLGRNLALTSVDFWLLRNDDTKKTDDDKKENDDDKDKKENDDKDNLIELSKEELGAMLFHPERSKARQTLMVGNYLGVMMVGMGSLDQGPIP